MAKPIHIMRWAPADYVNDPAVKLALAQRDFVASTFYPLFLFHAFIQGGRLPAEPTALGAILGMRPVDVRRAVAYWTEQGKIKELDGSLYHERVLRDIEAELAFRAEQGEKGKLGGRPRVAKAEPFPDQKPVVDGRKSPPSPLPAPAPAPFASTARQTPAPLPPSGPSVNPLVAGRRPELEMELLRLVRREAELTDRDGAEVMAEVTSYEGARTSKLNPASMSDDRLMNSVLDARARVKRLEDQHGRQVSAG